MAQQRGRLVQWNDERGFGFIESPDGRRHFAHISAFERSATRPLAGDPVSFAPVIGADGRAQASAIRILKVNAPPRPIPKQAEPIPGESLDWRLPMILVLTGVLGAGLLLGSIPWQLGLAYLAMGAVSLLAYGSDKLFARTGQWRTSEATLLGLDFCFGIIGGLLGQSLFRHKTRKAGFVSRALVIAIVHLLWLTALTLGLIEVGGLLNAVG
jgi:Predicted membrane protein